MYDLVKWFLMPSTREGFKLANGDVYGRETHHLEGMNLTKNTPAYLAFSDTGKTMVFTKSPQGFPLDMKTYDGKFIYDLSTELGWASPRDFKQFNPPLAMCQRDWNGDTSLYQFHQYAPYDVYQNCAVTGHGDVGPAYYTIEGPYDQDYQGDIGVCRTILMNYYWTDTKDREQLFLTDRFGWPRWTHATLQKLSPNVSQYKVDDEVLYNMVVPGVVPPQFPCQVIP